VKPLHSLAVWYARWLMNAGDGEAPKIIFILVFAPLALLAAFVIGIPYDTALWHGASINAQVYGCDTHGRCEAQPIRPYVDIQVTLICVSLPLLLSAIVCLRGWLGQDSE
jgi:hypothetical protein